MKTKFNQFQKNKSINFGKLAINFILLFVTQFLFAINYYVSPAGNDDNDGQSINTSFLTIERSTYAVAPGDTVFIRNGVYSKNAPESLIAYLTISGTQNNPITYKNYPGENPILQMNSSNWAGFSINGNDYIIIDGITIIGNNDNITLEYALEQKLNIGNPATSGNGIAINTEYNNETNKPHHNIIRNCKISKCGGGGIYTYNADYTTIENNVISECGWYAPYGNSGISLYQNWNSDANTGFKNFITGNTCFRNENFVPFFVVGSITDGNGIIIDDGRNTQNNSTLGIYNGGTYIANNLIFDNGARGIHCFESDNVLAINNTCYQNCKSQFTREGELTAFSASNINFYNNIVSPAPNVPPIKQFDANNVIVRNNLFTNNASLSDPAGFGTIIASAGFINPSINFANADFHLQQNSAAINAGFLNPNAPLLDKDGNSRFANSFVDIGCYEFENLLKNDSYKVSNISINPNPATDFVLIQVADKQVNDFLEITIVDGLGKKIKTAKTNENFYKINISDLQPSVYFLNIKNGSLNKTEKIIIE